MVSRRRIAVLGGGRGARHHAGRARRTGLGIRVYVSGKDGGRGEAARLLASVRNGGVDGVVIVRRFNSHSVSEAVRALCSRMAVPCRIVDSAGELPAVFDEWR